jgi:TRAP-type C4-dicarboxylate transport system permease small subunit
MNPGDGMLDRLVRQSDRAFDFAVDGCAFLSGALIFLTMLGTSVDVLSRYLFNRPIQEMVALTEFALLYITFLAAPWLLKMSGHIQMDFFVSRMSPRRKAAFEIVGCILGVFISLVLIWYGTQVTRELWIMKVHDLFKLEGFPKAIIVAIIPIGSILLLFQFIKNLSAVVKSQRRETHGISH